MDYEKRIKEKEEELQKLADTMNQLEQQKQALFRQAMQIEGAIKILKELKEPEKLSNDDAQHDQAGEKTADNAD